MNISYTNPVYYVQLYVLPSVSANYAAISSILFLFVVRSLQKSLYLPVFSLSTSTKIALPSFWHGIATLYRLCFISNAHYHRVSHNHQHRHQSHYHPAC
ncbi:MAG: hypothetical protein LAT67_01265 [Balneolales bacterium]|nr:hypothetical protein [Balneolales bacterium]